MAPRGKDSQSEQIRKKFVQLRRELHTLVPDDGRAMLLREAIDRAIRQLYLEPLYRNALAAYYEVDQTRKSPRRTRLINCALALLDHPEPPLVELANDYEALTNPGGVSKDSLVYALYHHRTWEMLLRHVPQRRNDRESQPVGWDLELPEGCKPEDYVVLPLTPLQAVAAITDARELPSMEACLQKLKRAKRKALLQAKLPDTRERT